MQKLCQIINKHTRRCLYWRDFAAIAGENWVNTIQGAKQVKNLVHTPCTLLVDGNQVYIDGFQPVGEMNMVKVDSYRGQYIVCTDDVQFTTYGSNPTLNMELKTVKDLKIRVQHPFKKHKNGRPIVFSWGTKFCIGKNYVGQSNEKNQDLVDWGWITGQVVGDGTYRHGIQAYVAFYVKDLEEEAEQCAWKAYNAVHRLVQTDYFQTLIPTQPRYYNQAGGYYRIKSVKIQKLVENLIESGNKNILPNLEMQSLSFLQGFIKGFFGADGHVQKCVPCIILSNNNLHNLIAVQRILQRHGIMSSIYKARDAGQAMFQDRKIYRRTSFVLQIFQPSVSRFYSMFGFGCQRKNRVLQNHAEYCKPRKSANKTHFTTEFKEITQLEGQTVYELIGKNRQIEVNGILVYLVK